MAKELKRILIANRGEIALRAIRTIKEMGKEAVVVYSKGDKDASYLKFADAAICIGDVCIVPPNSFALARTVEYFKMPPNVLAICLGKSTYAICGTLIV